MPDKHEHDTADQKPAPEQEPESEFDVANAPLPNPAPTEAQEREHLAILEGESADSSPHVHDVYTPDEERFEKEVLGKDVEEFRDEVLAESGAAGNLLPDPVHRGDDVPITAEYALGRGPVTGVGTDPPGRDTPSNTMPQPGDEGPGQVPPEGWEPPLQYTIPDGRLEGALPKTAGLLMPQPEPQPEQETMDGSPSLVHLFQEIPGDTEVPRQLLYGSIQFQAGPIAEVGINGGTIEGVVEVLKERLEGFQQGDFACPENDQAIKGLQQVLNVLALRTRRRREQGVEGTNAPHREV